jgi:hypothetical protein
LRDSANWVEKPVQSSGNGFLTLWAIAEREKYQAEAINRVNKTIGQDHKRTPVKLVRRSLLINLRFLRFLVAMEGSTFGKKPSPTTTRRKMAVKTPDRKKQQKEKITCQGKPYSFYYND